MRYVSRNGYLCEPGVEKIADHGTIGLRKYLRSAERKRKEKKGGKKEDEKKKNERKRKEGRKKRVKKNRLDKKFK